MLPLATTRTIVAGICVAFTLYTVWTRYSTPPPALVIEIRKPATSETIHKANENVARICHAYAAILFAIPSNRPPSLYEYLHIAPACAPSVSPSPSRSRSRCSTHQIYLAVEPTLIRYFSPSPGGSFFSDDNNLDKTNANNNKNNAVVTALVTAVLFDEDARTVYDHLFEPALAGGASDRIRFLEERCSEAWRAGKERIRAEMRAQRAAAQKKDGCDGPPTESSEKTQGSTIITSTIASTITTFLSGVLSWVLWLLTRQIIYIPGLLFYFLTPALHTLHATLCATLQTLPPSDANANTNISPAAFALNALCPSHAPSSPSSYPLAPAPPVPRYADALPNLAAWASHATDFTPLPPSAGASLASFETAVRAALAAVSSNQRAARNIAREKSAGPVRWFHRGGVLNTPASAARARIGRLKIVLDAALRTFEGLVELLQPSKLGAAFGPMEATCGWKRALGKKEKALRGVGVGDGDDGDTDTGTGEVLAVVQAQGAVAGIACAATGAAMEQLRGLRGRLLRGVVPGLVELGRAVRGVEMEAREKGGWATGKDVERWEEEVLGLAVEFERVVKGAWDGWNEV
ncbi:hypothetical protein CcaCcLH18_11326 [Colletotrichum camelliae]|nr:hypothetical protein CcaCcLH18_11326 [Colletotrichum camelliae]